jgi:putative membrane protein
MLTPRIIHLIFVAIAVCGWLAPSVFAGQRQKAVTDQSFVQKAVVGGLAEVQLGKLATDHAASPDVKQFGQLMVKDHEQANQALTAVAMQKGLAMPTALDRKHRRTATRLATLQGAAFDRAYIQQMVKDHEADVRLFSTEAREGQDPELKRFAADTLPILEKHLTLVRQLAQHHP